ncbi:LAQU0S27e00210g1_1 [Lachancea quebecensis]|uniref:LAQU0S27e00210g1_1 n=1 Tax=Lachancea quebecensis TaxID=1654605 RepID=A0A0P1KYC6_9SACH|nr:LAQU0S27e00210g1_1 [Lachancea quebecensis]
MVRPNPYLLGKFLDPIFAIGVGTMSYYSYERKVGRPEGHSLNELIKKRWGRVRAGKQAAHE